MFILYIVPFKKVIICICMDVILKGQLYVSFLSFPVRRSASGLQQGGVVRRGREPPLPARPPQGSTLAGHSFLTQKGPVKRTALTA